MSFVNPHDIAWYPRFTRTIEGQNSPRSIFRKLPANFETRHGREERNKPEMQRRAMQIANELFGIMPDNRERQRLWTRMLDTYLLMQNQVDIQVGLVLDALRTRRSPTTRSSSSRPTTASTAAPTACAARGSPSTTRAFASRWSSTTRRAAGRRRRRWPARSSSRASTSPPLMLTLATGGNDWRGDSTYAQIAGRADIAGILQNPSAPRSRLHRPRDRRARHQLRRAEPAAGQARAVPHHVGPHRHGKIARYAFWKDGTFEIDESKPIQYEAYDLDTPTGRAEIDNIYDKPGIPRVQKAFVRHLRELLDQAMADEIQQPLPAALQPVQQQAFADWFSQPPAEFTRETDN